MKNKSFVFWLAAMTLSALFLFGCTRTTPASSNGKSEPLPDNPRSLTIMVYMVGSDLETDSGAATSDIDEMQSAHSCGGQANILLYTGGSKKWWNDIPSDQNSIFLLDDAELTSVSQTSSLNMGDPGTLTDFLDFSYANYPADKYALILWDHGAGPIEGYGFDELHDYDHLTLSEMHQALTDSALCQAGTRFTWIGFDACLMSSVETANVFSDFTDYMIASQEAVPNQGWDYSFLSGTNTVLSDGQSAARRIIDAYANCYDQQNAALTNSKKIYTLSCLDLKKTGRINTALNMLFSQLNESFLPEGYSKIAQKRSSMPVFGRFTLGQYSDLVDLKQFASLTSDYTADASGALISAVDDMVLYSRTNQQDANGISIFFPYENTDYLKLNPDEQFEWQTIYDQFNSSNTYPAFLSNFSRLRTGAPMTNWRGESAPKVGQDMVSQTYFLQLSAEQAANFETAMVYVVSYVDGDEYQFLQMGKNYTLDQENRVYANFENRLIYVTNDSGETMIPWVSEQETIGDIVRYQTLVMLYRFEYDEDGCMDFETYETLSCEMSFERNRATNEISIVSVIPIDSEVDKPYGKQEVNLEEWDYIDFFNIGRFLTRNEDGEMLPFIKWETSEYMYMLESKIEDGFKLEYLPIDDEERELFCTITVRDTQGNLYTTPLLPANNPSLNSFDTTKQNPLTAAPFTIEYDVGASDKVTILDDDKVTIKVKSLSYNEKLNHLDLSISATNKTSGSNAYYISGVYANEYLMDASTMLFFGETDTDDATISLPLNFDVYHPSLKGSSIYTLTTISFFISDNSHEILRRVQIDINFDPKPYYVTSYDEKLRTMNTAPQILYQQNDLTVTLENIRHAYGSSFMYLELFFQNDGVPLNGIMIDNVSISGVMIEKSEIIRDPIPTGVKGYCSFSIDLEELSSLGINSVDDISFSIQPQATEFNALIDRKWVSLISGSNGFVVSDAETSKAKIDTEGATVLINQEGIKILILPKAPNDFKLTQFVIYNNTDVLVSVSSQDETLNGENTNDLYFYTPSISPGKCAITSLSDYYNLLAPGSIFSMRIFVKDIDLNRLLLSTQAFDLEF